jgi:hypothetical protein
MVTHGSTGFAERDHLGVRGWVGVRNVAIPSAADDAALADNDCTHRHLSALESALSAAQRLFHPKFI